MANPKYLPTGSDWVITRGICYHLVRGGHCRSLKIPTLFEAGIVRLQGVGCWGTKTKEDSSHANDFFGPARLVQMFCYSADESLSRVMPGPGTEYGVLPRTFCQSTEYLFLERNPGADSSICCHWLAAGNRSMPTPPTPPNPPSGHLSKARTPVLDDLMDD